MNALLDFVDLTLSPLFQSSSFTLVFLSPSPTITLPSPTHSSFNLSILPSLSILSLSTLYQSCLSNSPLQGSTTLGLKSQTHAILVALKRAQSDLSAHQKKIFPIDDHIAVSIAGLTADGRSLRCEGRGG